ncbi:l1p family of ribosomal protein, partial [Cystoisospora suis]
MRRAGFSSNLSGMGAGTARPGQGNVHVPGLCLAGRRSRQPRLLCFSTLCDNERFSRWCASPVGDRHSMTNWWQRRLCGSFSRHLASSFNRTIDASPETQKETVGWRTGVQRGSNVSDAPLIVSQEQSSFSRASPRPAIAVSFCGPPASACLPFSSCSSSPSSHPALLSSLHLSWRSFSFRSKHGAVSLSPLFTRVSECALLRPTCSLPVLFIFSGLRFKRYIPFHTPKNPKSKNATALPPPLFASATLNVMRHAVLPSSPSEAEYALSGSLRLSPFQAVRVLQAFLPPAANRLSNTPVGPLFTLQNGPLGYVHAPLRCLDGSSPAPPHVDSAPRVSADGVLGEESLVYLTLNVAADLKRESVRGVCTLQHGVGSNVRLAVFCPEEEAPTMLALGADYAGVDTLIPRIAKGWVAFDKTLAVANVMPKLLKVARVLGPRKLMPSPKSGSVVSNLSEAVRAVKSGECVEFRAEGETGEVRVVVGRRDFTATQLLDNIKCVVKE